MDNNDTRPPVQRLVRLLLSAYMRIYHRMEIDYGPGVPARGPFLALTSHFSLLDPVALIVADPDHPHTSLVVRDSFVRVPIVGQVLRAWGAVTVARDGRDMAAVRGIWRVLRQGRGICIAAEGTRSRTGRLGPLHPVLVDLALRVAREGIPVVPIVEAGTFEALPPGARFPRPKKIRVVSVGPVDLSPWLGEHLSRAQLSEAAAFIQCKLAELLPPEQRPAPSTPSLRISGILPQLERGEHDSQMPRLAR